MSLQIFVLTFLVTPLARELAVAKLGSKPKAEFTLAVVPLAHRTILFADQTLFQTSTAVDFVALPASQGILDETKADVAGKRVLDQLFRARPRLVVCFVNE